MENLKDFLTENIMNETYIMADAEIDVSTLYRRGGKFKFMVFDYDAESIYACTANNAAEMTEFFGGETVVAGWYDDWFNLKVGQSLTKNDGTIVTRIR